MKKIDKRKIIYITIGIIVVLLVYYFFTKDDYYLEDNINLEFNKEQTNEELANNSKENSNINKIKVYITGAVKNQGIYEMEENSRIADVIEMAGGLIETANIEDINLAYTVEDGMKIHIPKIGENIVEDNTETYITKENGDFQDIEKEEKSTKNKININTATQTELETLPGIGSSTALKIIEYRQKNGKFKNIEDIKNVSGIGDNKFLKIKDLIKT